MNNKLLLLLLLGISLNTNALNVEASLSTAAKINAPVLTTALHYAAIGTAIFIVTAFLDYLFSDSYSQPTQDIQNNTAVFIIPSSNEVFAEITQDILDTKALSNMKYINVQLDGE